MSGLVPHCGLGSRGLEAGVGRSGPDLARHPHVPGPDWRRLMRARRRGLIGATGALTLLAGLVVGLPTASAAVSPSAAVVVNEVYGGGGNAGATYKRDFVELYNTTDAPVSLAGWSVQYASGSGTTWTADPIQGTIPAHSFWTVAEGAGTGGTVDTPDDESNNTGTLALSGTGGKVLLANVSTKVACGTTCSGD